jgi:hypothetical protein
MKSLKSKEDLIEKVVQQIQLDLDCGFKETIEALLGSLSADTLINFLPEEDWKPFKHLRDDIK